ncbi:hypothetical protein FB45DRAFT_937682 [Roridomyces roridus]|uniref:F-box domain-containing protein n=1 Tax=Roridomyces roridus TaxID=1738132 RepID=A0AAD7B9J5_9AGAR|nr:hypothetical protein FB45DRAFT_937682 [Roridomyces roridus]
MASLQVLLTDTESVSAFSAHDTRLQLIRDIDLALDDIAQASTTSPVLQALKLFRSRPTKLGSDSAPTAEELAREVVSGKDLDSFPSFELSILQQALCARRNSLAVVSRLPPELLAVILELCRSIDDDEPKFRTRRFIPVLKITHVCRRWRHVALASAAFWSCIVLSSPRWALEMLERSRNAPLTVGMDMASGEKKTVAARHQVLGQVHRIRELHLTLPMFDSMLPPSLFKPAPVLEAFYFWSFGRVNSIAPASLFGGEAPALRHLSLRSCQIHPDSPLWNNIVSLELIKVTQLPTGCDLFTFLATRMPRLRALSWCMTETSLAFFGKPLEMPVRLDLETLELNSSNWPIYWFLRNLILPKCRITVHVPYAGDIKHTWRALEEQRVCADQFQICAVTLTDLPPTTKEGTLEVGLFDRTCERLSRYTARFDYDLSPMQPCRENILSAAALVMSLDSLTTLTINCASLWRFPPPIIHHATVRTLILHRHVEPFTQQLDSDPLLAAGDPTRFDAVSRVYFPALRKIHFHDIVFEQEMEAILDWLAQRRRLNVGIEEVRLIRCSLSGAELGSLKEVVTRVSVQRV